MLERLTRIALLQLVGGLLGVLRLERVGFRGLGRLLRLLGQFRGLVREFLLLLGQVAQFLDVALLLRLGDGLGQLTLGLGQFLGPLGGLAGLLDRVLLQRVLQFLALVGQPFQVGRNLGLFAFDVLGLLLGLGVPHRILGRQLRGFFR